jgi:flavin reductase (DIM6/NTAB) family NADH-FMN oxidoreductase RutF
MSVHTHAVPQFDTRDFRRSLGQFATGVTIITARAPDGHPVGFTANSFSSVSLDPPLVLWNLATSSPNLAVFQGCSHYAVNVLAREQLALSQRFAASSRDKFADVPFDEGAGGAPLLTGCCAWFECGNEFRYPGGDHVIFVGRVERYARAQRQPLLYFNGHYCVIAEHPEAPHHDHGHAVHKES